MSMRLAPLVALLSFGLLASGCAGEGDASAVSSAATAAVDSTPAPTTAAPSTVAPTTVAPTTVPHRTVPPTTVPPSTVPPTTVDPELIETRQLGESVEGRPIVAERRGTPGGRVVLVIGVIHGNENDGLAIVERLHRLDVPDGVDLWLVDSMNPDGVAHDVRHNANQVDLNRNFPQDWGPIGVPGDGQYAGTSAASEPETQAMVAFIERDPARHDDLVPPGPVPHRPGSAVATA